MKKRSLARMAEEIPQVKRPGKREGQKRYAPEVRLPSKEPLSNITNQIKSGVADYYHDSPHPPAQSSAGSKGNCTPLIQKLIHGDLRLSKDTITLLAPPQLPCCQAIAY